MSQYPYKCYPLGDTGLTIDFGNTIDPALNAYVLSLFHYFKKQSLPGIADIVPAYSTLSFHYNIYVFDFSKAKEKSFYEVFSEQIKQVIKEHVFEKKLPGKSFQIPVCYEPEFAPDLDDVSAAKKLSVKEIIRIHTSSTYRVYMNGFLPGFAYMGEVNNAIKMPRKSFPRKKVLAGSVGLAGKQTGIYPLASPGGWQIIGRTPLKIFDKEKDEPVLLQPGDEVQFFSISKNEFENYKGRNT